MRAAVALACALLLLSACKKEGGVQTPSCDERVETFEAALSSSSAGTCTTDADCRCYPGGVSKKHGCGGISDAKTTEKLVSIANDYRNAGCKSGIDCAASMCLPSCKAGRCTDGPPPNVTPSATPEAGVTCASRGAELEKLIESSSRKCTTNQDCACFRGSVVMSHPCGGVVDAKTNARFEALAKEWSAAGCKLENIMCPAMVCSPACNNGTCGGAGANQIIQ